MLDYTLEESIARDRKYHLLSPIVSYEENEMFWLWSLDVIFTKLYFLHGPSKIVLHYTLQERIARYRQSRLFCPDVSYEENEMLWIRSLDVNGGSSYAAKSYESSSKKKKKNWNDWSSGTHPLKFTEYFAVNYKCKCFVVRRLQCWAWGSSFLWSCYKNILLHFVELLYEITK